jgi:hypothetical protein
MVAISRPNSYRRDVVAQKFDREYPIPSTKLQGSRGRPSFASLIKLEIRILAGIGDVLHLLFRHPGLQALIKRQNLTPVSIAMEEWANKGLPDNGDDRSNGQRRRCDLDPCHCVIPAARQCSVKEFTFLFTSACEPRKSVGGAARI